MSALHAFLGDLGLIGLVVAAVYGLLTLLAVLIWQARRRAPAVTRLPPVTVLKPLCGAEPGLYENLRSFCIQNHPAFQIVFGVSDRNDPCLAVVSRLLREFPNLRIDVVIDPRQHGGNRKVSSLINMLSRARHDVLVMADSDACVGPDYLASVTAPLLDRKVGLVTCLYHGEPTPMIWSRLGAMYVNEWYMPSVLLARLFGHDGYASGQTICMRRETLTGIGGFRAIANHLADDYRLGELIRLLGMRIVVSPYVLRAEHHEPSLDVLVSHEVRWMRTLRILRPFSFRLMFLGFSFPVALVGLLLCSFETWPSMLEWTLFEAAVVSRIALHFAHRLLGARPLLADLWLLPARDVLLCWVWWRTFSTSRITWRGSEFDVDAHGTMRSPS
jgi:ceramide glucosyltransferase